MKLSTKQKSYVESVLAWTAGRYGAEKVGLIYQYPQLFAAYACAFNLVFDEIAKQRRKNHIAENRFLCIECDGPQIA